MRDLPLNRRADAEAHPAIAQQTSPGYGSHGALLSAQRLAGNRAVVRLLALQRQQDPPSPPPVVSPEDRQRQLYAATTMRNVPPPDAVAKAGLARAVSFAPVYDDIQQRDKTRNELDGTRHALDEANNDLSIASNDVKDVSGAAGGTGPGSGEPEKTAAHVRKAKAEVGRLSMRVELLAGAFTHEDGLVKAELKQLGVQNESELLTFVEDTFPESFVTRGAQIALAQLEANKTAALKEQERYQKENSGSGDRKGLQDACRDLDARTKEIADIYSARTTTLPPGGADEADPGVRELAEVQSKAQPKQIELDKKRGEYQLKYPILFKLDPQAIVAAGDAQLDAIISGPVKVVLDNVEKTKANISDGSLKIWKLKAAGVDIPQLTRDDLGIQANSTLDRVVAKKAAEDKTAAEQVTEALNALSMVADVVALVTGPVGVAAAAGINAVAAVANVVQDYQDYSRQQAAGNIAIDPDAAAMVQQNPDLEGLIFSLAMAAITALSASGAIRTVVNEYKKAKAAAKNLSEFKKLIRETTLDDVVKERLVAEATTQFAKAPMVDAKLLKAQFTAIGAGFGTGEKVSVARVLKAFSEDALAKSFLELEGSRIFKATPEGIDAAFGAGSPRADELKKAYFGAGVKTVWSRGFTAEGIAFIRPDSMAAVAEAVSHELPHVLQVKYEMGYACRIFYFQEHQAFLKQQEFLRRARTALGEAGFAEAFTAENWLVDATDERITEQITKDYGRLYGKAATQPPSDIPVNREELNAQLQAMFDKEELKRAQFKAVAKKLTPR
ncbi:MAG: hypothetical protein ACJ73S_03440 [Mycobacteriales bacterium]